MISDAEAHQAILLSDADLLRSLGTELVGPQAFPLLPQELVERATRWLTAQTTYLQTHICGSGRIRSFVETKDEGGDVEIVIELAKLLADLLLPVNPVTLAALLAKRGLKGLCETQWSAADVQGGIH